jgi:acetylglutamate kinase
VLAGTVNTRLVAALVAAGLPAVGLTGVDAAIGLSGRAPAHRNVDGRLVDLGLVGQPVGGSGQRSAVSDQRVPGGGRAGGGYAGGGQPGGGHTGGGQPGGGHTGGGHTGGGHTGGGHAGGGQRVAGGGQPKLLADLVSHGYVPVIACLGIDPTGQVLNVNADTLAAALAVGCRARRLIIAGATAGVLDGSQSTLSTLDEAGIDRMIADGSASAGMVAKLRACRDALHGGVQEIAIVSGRHADGFLTAPGTRIIAHAGAGAPTT